MVVRTHEGEFDIDADSWSNDVNGDLDCCKGDDVIATFPRGYWCAVYDSERVMGTPPVKGKEVPECH